MGFVEPIETYGFMRTLTGARSREIKHGRSNISICSKLKYKIKDKIEKEKQYLFTQNKVFHPYKRLGNKTFKE